MLRVGEVEAHFRPARKEDAAQKWPFTRQPKSTTSSLRVLPPSPAPPPRFAREPEPPLGEGAPLRLWGG